MRLRQPVAGGTVAAGGRFVSVTERRGLTGTHHRAYLPDQGFALAVAAVAALARLGGVRGRRPVFGGVPGRLGLRRLRLGPGTAACRLRQGGRALAGTSRRVRRPGGAVPDPARPGGGAHAAVRRPSRRQLLAHPPGARGFL
ncbi:hypothetical protein Shyhy01_56020 [Streptomyces hygroscopicus subsp. hygroscopicus]|nr:hypothetical protein Shyhy01_56020 [Streptomyces hygroscopicus subsp. hygroscopicus]